ncbi:MAG: kelch repeat-containing protein [Nitrososphaerales archaeon]
MRKRKVLLGVLVVLIGGILTISGGERVLNLRGQVIVGDLEWGRGADLPVPRSEVAVAALGDQVYVVGGLGSGGQAMYDVISEK